MNRSVRDYVPTVSVGILPPWILVLVCFTSFSPAVPASLQADDLSDELPANWTSIDCPSDLQANNNVEFGFCGSDALEMVVASSDVCIRGSISQISAGAVINRNEGRTVHGLITLRFEQSRDLLNRGNADRSNTIYYWGVNIPGCVIYGGNSSWSSTDFKVGDEVIVFASPLSSGGLFAWKIYKVTSRTTIACMPNIEESLSSSMAVIEEAYIRRDYNKNYSDADHVLVVDNIKGGDPVYTADVVEVLKGQFRSATVEFVRDDIGKFDSGIPLPSSPHVVICLRGHSAPYLLANGVRGSYSFLGGKIATNRGIAIDNYKEANND